jgi:hypothetical protein
VAGLGDIGSPLSPQQAGHVYLWGFGEGYIDDTGSNEVPDAIPEFFLREQTENRF